jgi:hypothetical protein
MGMSKPRTNPPLQFPFLFPFPLSFIFGLLCYDS